MKGSIIFIALASVMVNGNPLPQPQSSGMDYSQGSTGGFPGPYSEGPVGGPESGSNSGYLPYNNGVSPYSNGVASSAPYGAASYGNGIGTNPTSQNMQGSVPPPSTGSSSITPSPSATSPTTIPGKSKAGYKLKTKIINGQSVQTFRNGWFWPLGHEYVVDPTTGAEVLESEWKLSHPTVSSTGPFASSPQ